MANEFLIDHETGVTLYVLLFDVTGQVYNGATFVAPSSASWTDYDIAMSEVATATGIYRASMPAVAADAYGWVVRQQVGASPAPSDIRVGVGSIRWTGTTEETVPASANVTRVMDTALTETGAGRLAAAFSTFGDVATPVLTAASVNQTADVATLATTVGAAGAGLTALGDTRLANLDAAVSTRSTYAGGAVASVSGAVGSIASGGITAGSFAAGAIDAAAIAAGAIDNAAFAADVGSTTYATNIIALAADKAIVNAALATATELGKVPKSDGAVSWNATALAAINAEVDGALNTAIPGSPTADSLNERVKAIDVLTEAAGGGDLAAIKGYVDDIGVAGAGLTVLATQASVNDLPTNAELATALAGADDVVLAAVAALNDLAAQDIANAGLLAPVGVAAAGSAMAYIVGIDTNVDAIRLVTDDIDVSAVTLVPVNNAGHLTVTIARTFNVALSGLTIPDDWVTAIWTAKTSPLQTDDQAQVQLRASNPGAGSDGLKRLKGAALPSSLSLTHGALTVAQSNGRAYVYIKDEATALLTNALGLVWDIKFIDADGDSDGESGTLDIMPTATGSTE